MRIPAFLLLFVSAFAAPAIASADTTVIDFEGVPDFTPAGNLYQNLGVTFQGATVLVARSAGGSLNDQNFPPHSGVAVVFDDFSSQGLIRIDFNTNLTGPVQRAGGFVTGNRSVTLSAFDKNGVLLKSVSTGGANYVGAGTGIPPNLFLEVASGVPIARVESMTLGTPLRWTTSALRSL